MTWRYHYPQREFPYARLAAENARRGHDVPEYELIDTGIFDDDRYWAVTVDFAKAAPEDVCVRITVHNRGQDESTVHLLPTLWFRNTWAWDLQAADAVPQIHAVPDVPVGTRLLAEHVSYGPLTLATQAGGRFLFCDNETNAPRLFGVPGRSPFPKDGINDHVVHGAPTVNPAGHGSKAAVHHILTVPAGQRRELRLRLVRGDVPDADLGAGFDAVMRARQAEAEEFFAALTPAGATADEARVLRQAIAGLMWGKQFYHYDVERWLDGDPAGPPPPPQRRTGRNAGWRHLNNADVISMPDPWEYPWYAAWDLAFHCVPIALVDPAFAKNQLILMLREWYMHPNGQIPAYEWARSSATPASSRPTRTGTTCCPSTSTSTATPAAASAPPTRPAGPRWSPTSSCAPPTAAPPVTSYEGPPQQGTGAWQ